MVLMVTAEVTVVAMVMGVVVVVEVITVAKVLVSVVVVMMEVCSEGASRTPRASSSPP